MAAVNIINPASDAYNLCCHPVHSKIIDSNVCEKRRDNDDIQDVTKRFCDDQGVCLSTKYYRKNKLSRDKIHKCPHCDYETTGPKQTLINHINAKHKAEKDKPFYCACCDKGFAQAANYEKHMKNIHGKIVKVTKTREQRKPYMYVITMGEYLPSSKNTVARIEYYKTHKHIPAQDLGKITYKDGKFLLQKDIHYDRKSGYIQFTAYTKIDYDEFIRKEEKPEEKPEEKTNKKKRRVVKKLILIKN